MRDASFSPRPGWPSVGCSAHQRCRSRTSSRPPRPTLKCQGNDTAMRPQQVIRLETGNSPRLSQLDSCFVERGTLQVKRLRRSPVIAMFPWNAFSDVKPAPKAASKERRDPLKLARYYQSLLDSGKFESRAALARFLGVSRARVTQVLRRLKACEALEATQGDPCRVK